jgi:hypothetical protein
MELEEEDAPRFSLGVGDASHMLDQSSFRHCYDRLAWFIGEELRPMGKGPSEHRLQVLLELACASRASPMGPLPHRQLEGHILLPSDWSP